ncbi:MAG TPA: phosphatase PAP2 family protein [Candidatus Dormibacteraeota bacterium]|nr:phosphatase PAP2 family protein [Candidatus Dormibacteraeota bacterium]
MTLVIAIVAQWGILIPAALVAASILLRRHWKNDVLEAAVAGGATIALVKIAGALVFEKRPFVVEHLHPLVSHAADNAFPSDHLAACGLAFAYLWPRSRSMAGVTVIIAAAIASARVLAHLHWPIDVATGFVLGFAAVHGARGVLALVHAREGSERRG